MCKSDKKDGVRDCVIIAKNGHQKQNKVVSLSKNQVEPIQCNVFGDRYIVVVWSSPNSSAEQDAYLLNL